MSGQEDKREGMDELWEAHASGRGLTRIEFLRATGAGALSVTAIGALVAGCGGSSDSTSSSATTGGSTTQELAQGGEINLLTWADYWAPESLKAYTQATGTKINQTNFTSNDEMFAKLNSASGSSYDIAIATGGWVPRLNDVGAIDELEYDRIPWQNVSPDLQGQNYDPDDKFSVPKDYGVQGVIYDPSVVKTDIATWQDFLDAGAEPGVSGEVSASNTPDELIGTGLWSLGIDWNTENEDEIRQGADVMQEFAPHVKAYQAGPVDGMVSGQFVMGQISHGAARNARIQDDNLQFVVPGDQSEIWVDCYILPKGSANRDQAYSFIQFMLEPEQQIADTSYIGYPTVLPGLVNKLPKSVELPDEIFVSPEVLSRVTSRIVNPDTQGLVAQLANEIMSS